MNSAEKPTVITVAGNASSFSYFMFMMIMIVMIEEVATTKYYWKQPLSLFHSLNLFHENT